MSKPRLDLVHASQPEPLPFRNEAEAPWRRTAFVVSLTVLVFAFVAWCLR